MLQIKTVEQAKAIKTAREITLKGSQFPDHGKPAESLDLSEEKAMQIAFVSLHPFSNKTQLKM